MMKCLDTSRQSVGGQLNRENLVRGDVSVRVSCSRDTRWQQRAELLLATPGRPSYANRCSIRTQTSTCYMTRHPRAQQPVGPTHTHTHTLKTSCGGGFTDHAPTARGRGFRPTHLMTSLVASEHQSHRMLTHHSSTCMLHC